MLTSNKPPFPAALCLCSVVVIIVLIVSAGQPGGTWPVTSLNARLFGGFYTGEMVVMATLLFRNRWSPSRLVLVTAFIVTVILSAASSSILAISNFERKALRRTGSARADRDIAPACPFRLDRHRRRLESLCRLPVF